LAISGDYAFISISAESENLLVYDVSDPSSPTEVNSLSIEGRPFWISVWENYLFVPGVEVDLLASGIYLVRLDANGVIDSHKLILIK
jgi:hypothetical protein